MRPERLRGLALLSIAAVVVLSVLASLDPKGPVFDVVNRIPGRDVTGHFVVMGLLAFFVALGFAPARLRGRTLGVIGCTLLVLVAVTLEELVQIAIPDRVFSFDDLSASWLGILVGSGLAGGVRHLARSRARSRGRYGEAR